MPDPILDIPLEAIAEDALARDRAGLDPDAQHELVNSIVASGLRMPIEVYRRPNPEGDRLYGLISGYRRLMAFRELHAASRDKTLYPTIPAFVRTPATVAEAITAMVEENAIRAEISPWEQAMVAITAVDDGVFETVETALETLYRNLKHDRRRRLRTITHLVEELDGQLTAPETLSQKRLLRLAAAANRGFGPLIRHALAESRLKDADSQWRLLQPILAESENPDIPAPRQTTAGTRPRRTWVAPRHALRVRREQTPDGWCLHFTGRDARGEFIDTVSDYIEQMLSPA
jgi:ParB family chromosome partitioning protein